MDDIITYSADEVSHLKHIKQVIHFLEKAGMRISPEKWNFSETKVEYLGFIVSNQGIKICPKKVNDILNFKTPETLRSLHSFLGLDSYYHQFIK